MYAVARGCWWGWHLGTVRLVSKAFFPCFLLGLAIGDGQIVEWECTRWPVPLDGVGSWARLDNRVGGSGLLSCLLLGLAVWRAL